MDRGLVLSETHGFGYPHEVWTQRLLQQYVREHAIEEGFPEVARISQGTISKIANASAIKPHKIRSYVQNRDPAFHEKAIVVLHTYEEANIFKVLEKEGTEPDTFILPFDEKNGIPVRDTHHLDLMPVPDSSPVFTGIMNTFGRGPSVCRQLWIW